MGPRPLTPSLVSQDPHLDEHLPHLSQNPTVPYFILYYFINVYLLPGEMGSTFPFSYFAHVDLIADVSSEVMGSSPVLILMPSHSLLGTSFEDLQEGLMNLYSLK